MKRKYTESQRDAALRWDAEHVDRLSLNLPRGYKAALQACAKERKTNVNRLIRNLIAAELGLDQDDNSPASND